MINKFFKDRTSALKGALFMSGSGSNAKKILEFKKAHPGGSWIPSVIITDVPLKSRAREIADNYKLPLLELDIREFYKERGESRMSLMSEQGRKIREEWTNTLREMLKPFGIDFGILAGFVPLTNITADFPCLNVHPGDLTVEENGSRLLVGLHTIPIEIAMLKGLKLLRSSVIIAQSYTGAGGEMDTGPILGISTPVEIDFQGYSLDQLKDIAAQRPDLRPVGGYKDQLEKVAKYNQELLKQGGDWVVFAPVVEDFAAGKFVCDENGSLLSLENGKWTSIKTIEYGLDSRILNF
jgi:folate-dependent phosphoribosylglycinamide formyltransferase PurN